MKLALRVAIMVACGWAVIDLFTPEPSIWARMAAVYVLLTVGAIAFVADVRAHRKVTVVKQPPLMRCAVCGASLSDVARGLECTDDAHHIRAVYAHAERSKA